MDKLSYGGRPQRKRRPLGRQLLSACRWLHTYLSSLFFASLAFFCVTGVTLNHPDWFGGQAVEGARELSFAQHHSAADLGAGEMSPAAVARLVEDLTGLGQPRSVEFDLEVGEAYLDYDLPAGYAYITMDVQAQTLLVEHRRGGLVTLLNDLHKGRHTGNAWSWFIDLSAIALVVFSLVGALLLLQLPRKLNVGLALVLLGSVTPVVLYLTFVPRFI